MSNRFIPMPATPPSPTNYVSGSKVNKCEISGPMNFQHVSGDMTRDRSKNAFDLTPSSNDNVLKKYIIERGIKEQDISGMNKQELIKKIVHSNFTWMPTNRIRETQLPDLVYATISTNNEKTPPTSPPVLETNNGKPNFTNYTSITSKFIDISNTPAPDFLIKTDSSKIENNHMRFKQRSPTPSVEYIARPLVPPPPPPSIISATSKMHFNQNVQTINSNKYAPSTSKSPIPKPHGTNALASNTYNKTEEYEKSKKSEPATGFVKEFIQSKPADLPTIVPYPPLLPSSTAAPTPPPPPPPPPTLPSLLPTVNKVTMNVDLQKGKTNSDDGNWDAHLESIRKGVTLKKVDQKSATISCTKPQAEKKQSAVDFLSELKLGINLRRAKNSYENLDDASNYRNESHA